MFITPSFKKCLIVEQFQGNYLKQRLLFYNAIIHPVMSYADIIWPSCDKDLLYRVLKLQKRAARISLYADRLAPSVTLFNKLGWIPFYEQC